MEGRLKLGVVALDFTNAFPCIFPNVPLAFIEIANIKLAIAS